MKLLSKHIPGFQSSLLAWYKKNQRKLPWRESIDPYRIWISEVMLQQTQVKTTIPYFFSFIDKFPTIEDLARSDLETVLKLWEGLGYYARARNLHKAASIVIREYQGKIPDTMDEFKKLPGVGDYIGAAVQSIAFNHPHAVVDGNVKRVIARLYCNDHPVNQSNAHGIYLKQAQPLLAVNDPGTYNQAMMELGALICTPRSPNCGDCPVSGLCCAFQSGQINTYPKRIKSKKVPTHLIAVGVVKCGDRMLITRRRLDGLLGGLWEFPGGKVKKGETSETACIREIKEETALCVKIESKLTRIEHAYTHFKIKMDVFYCSCRQEESDVILNGPIDYRWITLSEIDSFAFPKANNKFIPTLYENQ